MSSLKSVEYQNKTLELRLDAIISGIQALSWFVKEKDTVFYKALQQILNQDKVFKEQRELKEEPHSF